jgi:hypothetical protein
VIVGHDETLRIAQEYHAAWTSGNLERARGYLAPGLETDVPINSYSNVGEWMDAVARTRSMVERVDVLAEYTNEADALLLYDMIIGPPIGTLRIAEQFTVADGRITRIRHVHDTHALRSAMASHQVTVPPSPR